MLLTILSFFGTLLVLIIAHEVGHFTAAKIAGVKVEEFGIFMRPRLLHFTYKGTVYSLNAIPLGGFVQLAGEVDPDAMTKTGTSKEPVPTEKVSTPSKTGTGDISRKKHPRPHTGAGRRFYNELRFTFVTTGDCPDAAPSGVCR